jgi:hypothetical protein
VEEGIELFEWIKNPNNITRLRRGLQHVYAIERNKIRDLAAKLWENEPTLHELVRNYQGDSDDLADELEQQYDWFDSLRRGVYKLEAISNATNEMVIPRLPPRKRLGERRVQA